MKEGVALSQLADILPPPPPGGPDWFVVVGIGLACLVAVIALLWFIKKRHAPRTVSSSREARQKLAALHSAWQSHTVSDREAAYRLATLLRLGLALPQLDALERPPMVEDDKAWRETLQQLHTLRYRQQAGLTLSSHCFEHAKRWLTVAHRRIR